MKLSEKIENILNESKLKIWKEHYPNNGKWVYGFEDEFEEEYITTKSVKVLDAHNYMVDLPKGSIISNIPGGIFAKIPKEYNGSFRQRENGNFGLQLMPNEKTVPILKKVMKKI